MKKLSCFSRAVALSLPLLFVFAAPLSQAETGSHDHHDLSHAVLELNQGQKWAIDPPLRQGMDAIHSEVAGAIDRIHAGGMADESYQQLGAQINNQLAYIFENCKLPAAADAQLHIVLASVMQDLEAVEGKSAGQTPVEGVVGIAQMLNRYGDYFDHQGWSAIDLSH